MAKKQNPEPSTQEPTVQAPTIINRYAQQEGLRLLLLEAENFKGLKHVVLNFEGRSMLITGKNNIGKSSVIQVITGILNSKLLPSEAVKKGEENALISIVIGGNTQSGYKQYTASVTFTAKNQSGKLEVKNEKGELVKNGATILHNLIKDNSFDITSWLHQKKPQKLEMLKQLTGCAVQIDTITNEINNLKDTRKAKKERSEELEGALKNHEFSQDDIDKYSQPVDMSGLQAEYSQINQNISYWHDGNNSLTGLYNNVQASQNKIAGYEEEIIKLQKEIDVQRNLMAKEAENIATLQQRCLNGEEWKKNNPLPSLDDVNRRMGDAVAHNDKYNRIGMLGNQHKEMVTLKQEVDGFKPKIEALEKQRSDIISKSQLPVPGLTFSEDEIFITTEKGELLPLDEEQINKTTLFDIGAEIAMAMHPEFKLIFLHDSSLYDKDHLAKTVKMVEERGYQVIAELVTNSEELQFFFTEEVLK